MSVPQAKELSHGRPEDHTRPSPRPGQASGSIHIPITNFSLCPDSSLTHCPDSTYMGHMSIKAEINPVTGRRWVNLTGHTFGRWTVIELTGRVPDKFGQPRGMTLWKCQCSCGRIKEGVTYGALMSGASTSCGCFRGEVLGGRAKKHGDSKGKAYRSWQQAKQRCFNKCRPSWDDYGGRGITMCEGFRGNFTAWRDALGPPPTPKHSVDRRNNEGHYSCGICSQCVENKWFFNIHWATQSQQAQNTRRVRHHIWNGKLMSLTDIARTENVAYCSFRNEMCRLNASIEKALAYCRERGLTFNERAKFVLSQNPKVKTRPPNRTFKKKSVPNNVDSCPDSGVECPEYERTRLPSVQHRHLGETD